MSKYKFFLGITIYLFFFSLNLKADEIKKNCDLIGAKTVNFKSSSERECLKKCQSEASCQGMVFISGWKRCFLLDKIKREASLRMFSGEKGGKGKYNHDYSGKDLKRLAFSKKSKCQQACKEDKDCIGYTYLEGYRDCWIKNTRGKLFEKTFYCWQKQMQK